jgi:hypothetical protein
MGSIRNPRWGSPAPSPRDRRRSPRFAPESLEQRLSPTGLVTPALVGTFMPVPQDPPEPGPYDPPPEYWPDFPPIPYGPPGPG